MLRAEVGLADHPAALIVGPRASGKTTTARRRARTVIRLDRPAEADAVRADPDAVLAAVGTDPVVIDEWQVVPEILGAIKRAVDDDPRPGRFVITGSPQADLTASGWPAIGIEITADAAPGRDAARHLAWLEEALRSRFAAGVMFHTGPRPVPYSASIVGLPISVLWSVG
ncbi:MAG: AAA family ATPase [Kineosporiaceae bacterium]